MDNMTNITSNHNKKITIICNETNDKTGNCRNKIYIPSLKDQNKDFDIKWSIFKK